MTTGMERRRSPAARTRPPIPPPMMVMVKGKWLGGGVVMVVKTWEERDMDCFRLYETQENGCIDLAFICSSLLDAHPM